MPQFRRWLPSEVAEVCAYFLHIIKCVFSLSVFLTANRWLLFEQPSYFGNYDLYILKHLLFVNSTVKLCVFSASEWAYCTWNTYLWTKLCSDKWSGAYLCAVLYNLHTYTLKSARSIPVHYTYMKLIHNSNNSSKWEGRFKTQTWVSLHHTKYIIPKCEGTLYCTSAPNSYGPTLTFFVWFRQCLKANARTISSIRPCPLRFIQLNRTKSVKEIGTCTH